MHHILACDVGNTHIGLGEVFEEQASNLHRLGKDQLDKLPGLLAQVWAAMPDPKKIAACSVNPANLDKLKSAAAALGEEVLVVGADLPLPIRTDLSEPQRCGADRLCAAAMAYYRLRQACVVADCGTAITVDCVSDEGVFLGGAILPGLSLGASALAGGTALLPKVALEHPTWAFGKDTRQAIIGGLVYGARGAIQFLTEAYATELKKWPLLILTGGDAELIRENQGLEQAVVPELTLLGVALAFHLAKGELRLEEEE
jgi:type III pantothenate kinase